jgi:Colicin V production protein.
MSIAYDVVFVAVIVACFIYYMKQGIAKILLSFAAFLISLALAYVFSGILSSPKNDELLGGSIQISEGSILSSSRTLAFFVIFIVASIALGIVAQLLQKIIKKVPVIGLANRILGGALGLVIGVVYCYVIVSILAFVIISTGNQNEWVNTGIIEKTYLVSLLYRYNLLALF